MVLVLLSILVLLRVLVDNEYVHRQMAFIMMGIAVLAALRQALFIPVTEAFEIDYAGEIIGITRRTILGRRVWMVSFAQLRFQWYDGAPELWMEKEEETMKLNTSHGFTAAQLRAMHAALQDIKAQYHYPKDGENESGQGR